MTKEELKNKGYDLYVEKEELTEDTKKHVDKANKRLNQIVRELTELTDEIEKL